MSSPALTRHRHPLDHRPSRTADRRPMGSVPGRYRYDGVTDAWWWSPEMRGLLGLDESTAPSTTALLGAHQPADGDRLRIALTAARERGRPFALETRLLHPARGQRSLVLIGEPVRDESGALRGVEGVCADITGTRPVTDPETEADRSEALQTEVTQMRAAMASRAVIEQAKGILMLLTRCGDQVAFELLTHISSHTHRKVRDVAQALTVSAAGGAPVPTDVAAILRDACPPAGPVR